MKNLIILIFIFCFAANAFSQTKTIPAATSYIATAKDIIAKKTTISAALIDRIGFALDFYEQQKIKSIATLANNPKQLEIALSKIEEIKKQQLQIIIPVEEYKKLSAQDIITICK